MEEQYNERESFTRNLIRDGGLEKPSIDFSKNVMNVLNAKAKKTVYEPLISKKVWWFLGLAIICIVVLVYLFPMSDSSVLDRLGLGNNTKISLNFPKVHFSKITMYAVGFMALFLIEIPFLKRRITKSF